MITLCTIISLKVIAQDFIPQIKLIPLGEDTVRLHIFEKAGEQIVYVHVHENETASLEAGMAVLNKYGGKLITLVHSQDTTKNRNVSFRFKGTTYQFDPNRIYTSDDIILKKNIKVINGNGTVTKTVLKMVKNLASVIWSEASPFSLIVALHNNRNAPARVICPYWFWCQLEAESYNITSYVKKNDISSESNLSCSDIYINPEINNSEFFIVTDRRDFSIFYKKRYSVVLQNQNPVDDGSMSVFASKNEKRYINAEAKHERVTEQTAMLELIHQF
ncbi:MAG: hypothetical protein IPM42_13585 [Saprospiraceae bacterium]|nr:hypothetical protein [Saprospiraceae bacterium]